MVWWLRCNSSNQKAETESWGKLLVWLAVGSDGYTRESLPHWIWWRAAKEDSQHQLIDLHMHIHTCTCASTHICASINANSYIYMYTHHIYTPRRKKKTQYHFLKTVLYMISETSKSFYYSWVNFIYLLQYCLL